MRACGLIGFDLGGCIGGIVTGWAGMIPWWGWVVIALLVVGMVWKFAGWPGLLTLAAGVGFIFGRRSATERDDIWPHPDPKPEKAARKKRPTIFDRRRK